MLWIAGEYKQGAVQRFRTRGKDQAIESQRRTDIDDWQLSGI